jgi:hypothetical protein
MPPHKEPADTDSTGGFLQHDDDFSLALGGPLYQLYLRSRLSTPLLGLLHRRLVSISLFCWLPLLVLSHASGHLLRGVSVPFLLDLEVHSKNEVRNEVGLDVSHHAPHLSEGRGMFFSLTSFFIG